MLLGFCLSFHINILVLLSSCSVRLVKTVRVLSYIILHVYQTGPLCVLNLAQAGTLPRHGPEATGNGETELNN